MISLSTGPSNPQGSNPCVICAGTIVRNETLEKYPELEEVLELMTQLISDDEMIQMNYEVEKEKKEAQDVAREFLTKKGLL